MKQMAWAMERDGEQGKEVLLLISLEAEESTPRAPVAVNLLIDRSASMRGAPLVAAIDAAQSLVAQAGPRDYIGLLAFDGVPEQLLPVRAMEPDAKTELSERLSALGTGSGTALHEAVELGASSLHRVLVPGARRKLLLLTDGEPSVGPNAVADFKTLGAKVADSSVTLHALGLGRHYIPEILEALSAPSGTGFAHADDAEALPTTVAAMVTELFGEVASDARIHVLPSGFAELRCRHRYSTRLEGDAMSVLLGAVSQACLRRALFTGRPDAADWNFTLTASYLENGDTRRPSIPLLRVTADSVQGRRVSAVNTELDLVAAEGTAWKALSRRDVESAGKALAQAEAALRELVRLNVDDVPARRHLERLADLRLAVERRVAELPALLVRRAKAEGARTSVSQVMRLPAALKKKVEH
jgi:Ca-activated chloride channel homolog